MVVTEVYESIKLRYEEFPGELWLMVQPGWVNPGTVSRDVVLTRRFSKAIAKLVRCGRRYIKVLHLGMNSTQRGCLILLGFLRNCPNLRDVHVYGQPSPNSENLIPAMDLAGRVVRTFGSKMCRLTFRHGERRDNGFPFPATFVAFMCMQHLHECT